MFKKPKISSPTDDTAVDGKVATADRAIYEVADVAALDPDEIAEVLRQAEADVAARMTGCAHVVVTQDLSTGVVTHHLPCSSGLEALALAAQIVDEKRAADSGRPFTVAVIPLLPHQR